MGKLSLFLALIAAAAGFYTSSQSGRGVLASTTREAETQYRVVARSAAQAGLVRAQHGLLRSFTSTTLTGRFRGVAYRTEVRVTGNDAVVTSDAEASSPLTRGGVPFQIRARVQRGDTDGRLPGFLRYGIIAEERVQFSGTSEVASIHGYQSGDTSNVRVHSNNILSVQRNPVVRGFATYTGSSSVGDQDRVFVPYSNPTAISTVRQSGRIDLPAIVPAELLVANGGADVTAPVGTSQVQVNNARLAGGPRDNPRVYYYPGSRGVSFDNVTVDGYAVFISEGPVWLNGRIASTHDLDGRSRSSALAFYTPESIWPGSNSEIWGQLYTGRMFSQTGNTVLHGSVASRASFYQGGGMIIHQRPATAHLALGLGATIDPNFRLLAYAER